MTIKNGARVLSLVSLLLAPALAGAQSIGVSVNGDPVRFYGTQPQQIRGRVMVPLRGVLERLGAVVEWDAASQTAIATRGDTTIRLPIGSYSADVNGRSVPLDVPATVIDGSTMVPLRFVSQALGAQVGWNDQTRSVMITSDQAIASAPPFEPRPSRDFGNDPYIDQTPNPPVYRGDQYYNPDGSVRIPAVRQPRAHRSTYAAFSVPEGVVVPVRLDTPLSSDTSRRGDRFTATVRAGADDAGLPEGTRVEGVVREAIPARNGQPGSLDLDFRSMILPNGDRVSLDGGLISLDSKSVDRDSSGRMIARGNQSNDRLKFIGIGAAGGLLIGALTKNNALLGALLGAGAGYLYGQSQNSRPRDVRLGAGTEFGVRLNRALAYNM